MRRLGVAVVALLAAGCGTAERVPFGEGGEIAWFAVVELDEQGSLRAATSLRPFDGSASVFTGSDSALVLGWTAEALAALEPDAALLEPAEGCQPTLPTPSTARRLGADPATVDAASLPRLTAPWLSEACPDVDPEAFAFDLTCKKFRCPRTVTRTGACTFEIDLDCDVGRVDATVGPDGGVCLAPPAELACEAVEAAPPRVASLACAAPEPCRIEAYIGGAPPLSVTTRRLLDVPPFSPEPELIGQLVLPPAASRYLGYAHDLAVVGDRVAVSLGGGAAFLGCGSPGAAQGALEFYDAETLTRTASAAVTGCLTRLASGPAGLLGLRDTRTQFELVRFSDRGAIVDVLAADPRALPGAGEAPRLHTLDARATYFEVVGDALVAAVVTASPRGTKVFTWAADTLEPRTQGWLPDVTIVAAAEAEPGTVRLGATARSGTYTLDVGTGAIRGPVELPSNLVRDDNVTSDVAWSPSTGRTLLTLSRKNASLLELDAEGVRDRAVIFDADARPLALRALPGRDLALVAGAWSTDQVNWPASLHLYDLATHRFRPGEVPIGHGAPGRMLPDGPGRLWVLMPWDATLLRVSYVDSE